MEKALPRHVKYIPLSMKYKPEKRRASQPVMIGAGRRKRHAEHLARTVLARLGRMKFEV